MKKFFAILMVALIVVAAVFATAPAANDKAILTINAEIKIQYPVYSLQATRWVAGGTGTDANLGAAADVLATPGTSTVVIGDDVLTSTDTTVEFTIAQTTLSRVKGTYTLGVEATNLVIDKIVGSDGTKTNATEAEKAANFFAVSAAPTISKGASGTAPTNTTMVNSNAGALAVTYDGKKVPADTTIGTFQYTYTHNDEAAAGDYTGTVTLTITSIS